jgi:hypothetical protein
MKWRQCVSVVQWLSNLAALRKKFGVEDNHTCHPILNSLPCLRSLVVQDLISIAIGPWTG